MSKNKTKRARREAKREESRKTAALQRKSKSKLNPPPKKQKQKRQREHNANTFTPDPQDNYQSSKKREIPFGVYDNILLVGEGDFSFARSLVIEHGCANVTATSYDDEDTVREKYPTFETIRQDLRSLTPPAPIHHSIDARNLHTYKNLRRNGEGDTGWDTIAFMFPHTGGLSTDVNRQVRANQALLVDFFASCLHDANPNPAPNPSPRKQMNATQNLKPRKTAILKPGGRILVTLFTNPPYTLWNIRDLARHTGLVVRESFKFDFADYPGYAHVRTLGTLEGGGGWKGEEREARMYLFEKRGGEEARGKKRGRESESDED
ncbi:hypothetical protein CC78DRAFT_620889 [Lojkania enalia]|uniref:25S rRNA (uridine-N(3))-methyltransferase BMT5-like domain-containing protein n=1 Tax=Lojkania enalia TaxID=147567 RepID=A0A9P4K2G6_9PLEO|nr:hypothetical protein CC78DRAFT_620889 [Didymosphaeria enalia]